jgi:hypothetical protein
MMETSGEARRWTGFISSAVAEDLDPLDWTETAEASPRRLRLHELVGIPAGQPNPGFGWDASFALNGRQAKYTCFGFG